MKVKALEKVGLILKSENGKIEIEDANGGLFYYAEKPETKINLPKGLYFLRNCKAFEREPLEYKTFLLPEPTNKDGKKPPLMFREYLGKNPNKCTVNHAKDKLLWDKDFFNSLTMGEKDFIREHERGHYFYSGDESDELKCDLYAFNQLIEKGYNPRQIAAYIKNSLSNNYLSKHRKNQINDFARQIDNIHS